MAATELACRGAGAERRRQPRASASLRGAVERGDGITLGCHTRDASLTGLFVELATDEPGLPEGSRVSVEFIVNEPTGTRRFHADATVVRSAEHGVGLAFDRHQLNMLGYLYEVVHGAAVARRRTLERVRLLLRT